MTIYYGHTAAARQSPHGLLCSTHLFYICQTYNYFLIIMTQKFYKTPIIYENIAKRQRGKERNDNGRIGNHFYSFYSCLHFNYLVERKKEIIYNDFILATEEDAN